MLNVQLGIINCSSENWTVETDQSEMFPTNKNNRNLQQRIRLLVNYYFRVPNPKAYRPHKPPSCDYTVL